MDDTGQGQTEINEVHSVEECFHLMEDWTREKYKIDFYSKLLQSDSEVDVLSPDHILSEDIPQNLSGLAQTVIKQVKAAASLFCEYQENFEALRSLVDLDAVKRIERQLQEESVYICFLGRYNSGKTTLINALLGVEVLPVSDTPETAITLLIQDDDRSDQQSAVRLIHGDRLEASGVEKVREALESLHSGIRGKSRMPVEEYLMKIHFPSLKSPSESEQPKAFIVDTPGSNEVGAQELQKIAELNLKTAAAYIYVVTYSDIKNKEDYEALKTIYKRDKEIFHSERLTIVVTHFDKFYESNKKSSISRDQIKAIVAQTIQSEIGVTVSADIVIPLSGMWACKTRVCAKSNYSCDLNDVEMGSLSVLRVDNPGKTMRDYLNEIDEMGKRKVVKKLEDASGILEFERRIVEVNQRLSEIWKKNIVIGCTGFLESAISEMEHLEESITYKLKDWESRVQSAGKVLQYHKAMLDSVRQNSHFYETLKIAFDRDMNYESNSTQMLNHFKGQISDHVREKKKYGIEDLQRDVNAFSDTAEKKLLCFIYQAKFINCQRLLRQHTQRISEKFGRLRGAACLVMDPDVQPGTIQAFLNENDLSGDNDMLSQEMEVFAIDLNPINISDIVQLTFGQKLKRWIPFKRVEVIKDIHIRQVLDDRKEKLEALHQQIVHQIQGQILLYFFKAYCKVVIKELNIFTRQQEERANLDLLSEFQIKKKQLASREKQKENLHVLIDHFKGLKQRLLIQAN